MKEHLKRVTGRMSQAEDRRDELELTGVAAEDATRKGEKVDQEGEPRDTKAEVAIAAGGQDGPMLNGNTLASSPGNEGVRWSVSHGRVDANWSRRPIVRIRRRPRWSRPRRSPGT